MLQSLEPSCSWGGTEKNYTGIFLGEPPACGSIDALYRSSSRTRADFCSDGLVQMTSDVAGEMCAVYRSYCTLTNPCGTGSKAKGGDNVL